MLKLSLSKAWDDTRYVIAREARLVIAVVLALVVLPQTIFGTFMPTAESRASPLAGWIALAIMLLALVAQLAINRLSAGPQTTVGGALQRAMSRAPALVAAFLIVSLVMTILFVPLAIALVAMGISVPRSGVGMSPGLLLAVLIYFGLIFTVFQLMVPIAAIETGGPLAIVRRSWDLSRHNYLRLLAFLTLILIGIFAVWMATRAIAGIVTTLLFGAAEPGSLSAVVLALIVALVQAAFTAVSAVMLARIYVQLANADALVSVPPTGAS